MTIPGLNKFLEMIANAGWRIYEPTHRRQIAQAEADVAKTEAETKLQVARIEMEGQLCLSEEEQVLFFRAVEREAKALIRHQKNMDAILKKAKELVPEKVSPEPVDQDWLADWQENAKNVSNEDMQLLWAKLLAGELEKPGRFCKQTLGVLRLMSKCQAAMLTDFCSAVWRSDDDIFPVYDPGNGTGFDIVLPCQIPVLESLGLIHVRDSYFAHHAKELRYFDKRFQTPSAIYTGNVCLTQCGKELVQIAGGVPNALYLRHALRFLSTDVGPLVEMTAPG